MKQLQIQRAIFNKNTNNLMIGYLKELSIEELTKRRKGCMFGSIKEGASILDIFTHLVLCECLLYQNINKKAVISKYDKELLEYRLPSPLTMPNIKDSFEQAVVLINKLDLAIIELYENIDFKSYDTNNFTKTEIFTDNTPATFMEQLFIHAIHHRGQISQILAELGVGEDFSRFQKFGVFE